MSTSLSMYSCIHKDYMRYGSPQRANLIKLFLNNYHFWPNGIPSNCSFFKVKLSSEIPFQIYLRTEYIHVLQSTQRLHNLQKKQ